MTPLSLNMQITSVPLVVITRCGDNFGLYLGVVKMLRRGRQKTRKSEIERKRRKEEEKNRVNNR